MANQLLRCDKSERSHWLITLNRPDKRNALSDDLVGALLACLDDARAHDVPTLVFCGEGRNFSAGFDFTDFDQCSQADLLWRFVRVQQLLSSLLSYPGLTIGVAHGRNFGAGCDLFAACKIRLAGAATQFRMPGVLFGLVLGTRRFAQLVGESDANRILLSATEFDGDEAARIGFVTSLLGDDALQSFNDNPAAALMKDGHTGCVNAGQLINAVSSLSSVTRHAIVDTAAANAAHEDMSRLVTSVMQGDIKKRLAEYLGK